MTSSIFLFAQDVLSEGLQPIQDAGLDAITVAATYHQARDVYPHRPEGKVGYLEGDVAYFEPDPARYDVLKPEPSSEAQAFDKVCAVAEIAKLEVSAWLVVLHNTRLGERFPEYTQATAFGDRLRHALCPANPAVQRFATALATDVARFPLKAIKLEAVSYQPFDHGGHHERSFVPLSPNVRYLLGLCFCLACRAEGHADNIDVARLQRAVRERLQAVFDASDAETHEREIDDDWLRSFADGELGRFARTRERVVTSLVDEMTRAVHHVSPTTRVVYLDPSGATLGYATGRPASSKRAVDIAWRDGIDLRAIAQHVDAIGMLAYFAEPDRFASELATYQSIGAPLEAVLRPMPPDTPARAALAERMLALRQANVRDISFYHYGFMRLENLAWVQYALEQP